jgi:hypothetical protein
MKFHVLLVAIDVVMAAANVTPNDVACRTERPWPVYKTVTIYKTAIKHCIRHHSSVLFHSNFPTLCTSTTLSNTPTQPFKMSEQTFHTTRQDLRKDEARIAQQHGGKNPSDSKVSQMKVGSFHIPSL